MPSLLDTIRLIQEGDEQVREEFINSQKEFIRSFASFVCHRKLDWHNDDELSISLIAFNRAIDTFNPAAGKNFITYARVLIRNNLIDYFRSQQHGTGEKNIVVNELSDQVDTIASLRQHTLDADNLDRAYEIEVFKEILEECGVTIETLAKHSPRHRDTRENLKNIALKINCNEALKKRILKERRLPVKEIQALCGANRKFLDKWRKYILSLVIIAAHSDLEIMANYIWGKEPRSYR